MLPRYEIEVDRTALLVIDMQNAFVDPRYPLAIPEALTTVPQINALITSCRSIGVEVIWTAQCLAKDLSNAGLLRNVMPHAALETLKEDGDGVEFYPAMEMDERDIVINKPRFSAFYQTELEDVLVSRGIQTLIIVGTVLNVCCESTARDAFFRDLQVLLPVGLNSTRDHPDVGFGEYTAAAMSRAVYTSLGNRFVDVVSFESLMQRLHRARHF